MKQATFITFLLAFATLSFSQHNLDRITGYSFYDNYDSAIDMNLDEKEFIAGKKIKVRTRNIHLRDGKNSKEVEEFDVHGNLIKYQRFNWKSELVYESYFHYNEKQQMIYATYLYDNKKSFSSCHYDKEGRRTANNGYNHKGVYFGRIDAYGPHGSIVTTKLFEKDSIHPYKQLDYEYYDDNSLKSIRYLEKSKLKYTWSYDCKPEGELLNDKSQDTTLVCIKQEIDSTGNTVTWKQEINKKGIVEKVQQVTDKNGALLLTARYNKEGQKTNEKIHFKDGGYLQIYYDKNGIAASQREVIYNYRGELIKSSYTGSKWYYYNWNSYADGLVTTSTYLSKKNLRVTEYSYTYYP